MFVRGSRNAFARPLLTIIGSNQGDGGTQLLLQPRNGASRRGVALHFHNGCSNRNVVLPVLGISLIALSVRSFENCSRLKNRDIFVETRVVFICDVGG